MSKLTPNSVCVCGHTKANHDQDKCNGISLIRNGAKALCGCKSFQEAVLYPVAHESSATKLRDFAQLERELAEAIRKAQTAETNWFDAKHEYGKNVSELRRQLNEAKRKYDSLLESYRSQRDAIVEVLDQRAARARVTALLDEVQAQATTITMLEEENKALRDGTAVSIVYTDGTWKVVSKRSSWEYENDPDYLVTIPVFSNEARK